MNAAPPPLEARLELGWQRLRHWLLVVLLAAGLAAVALLVVGAVAAPFGDDRPLWSATLHISGRLWFIGVMYLAAAVPLVSATLRVPGQGFSAVRHLVIDRRYGRWLATIVVGAPVIGFAILEPTAALVIVAVLVAALVLLVVLGVGF